MRAVFVNHCHPDCSHVCGTRAREFAIALARQGHQIVLLTETLAPDDPALDIGLFTAALEAHDWSRPFVLACPPAPSALLTKQRAGRLPSFFSKAVVSYHYLLHGGVFTDWRAGTRPFWEPLAEIFHPDIVWGIFGNTDAWAIAQGIARHANCPWVRDIKDQWTAFIPAPFRDILARRFADAVASTALSEANADAAAPWFGNATVVYSGYPPELDGDQPPAPDATAPFTLVLVGATYNRDLLNGLVAGLARFLDTAERGPVRLVYAGTDAASASAALAPLQDRLQIDILNQLALPAFSTLIRSAHANLYVRMPKSGWWHHKIVELLAARRPIICYPGEIEEAKRMVDSVGGHLENPTTPDALARVLEDLWQTRASPRSAGDPSRLVTLGWPHQAEQLAAILERARA